MAVRKKVIKSNLEFPTELYEGMTRIMPGIPNERFRAFELPSVILGERVYPGNKSNGFKVRDDD